MTAHKFHNIMDQMTMLHHQVQVCHASASELGLAKTVKWLNDMSFECSRRIDLMKTEVEANEIGEALDAAGVPDTPEHRQIVKDLAGVPVEQMYPPLPETSLAMSGAPFTNFTTTNVIDATRVTASGIQAMQDEILRLSPKFQGVRGAPSPVDPFAHIDMKVNWPLVELKRPASAATLQVASQAPSNLSTHTLYKTGDVDAPEQILDRNGQVVLALCRACGKAEGELIAVECDPAWKKIDPPTQGEEK